MKTPIILSLCVAFALAITAKAQVQTQLGDVEDSRTTGQFFGGLKVQIKLLGDPVTDALSRRIIVKTAVDDTGRDLVDHEKEKNEFEAFNHNGGQNHIDLKLKNPARKASTIKELSGEVELFTPKNDPDSVVTIAGFQALGGKPIESPALAAAGIEISTYTKEQSDTAKAKNAEKNKKDSKANIGDALSEAFAGMFSGGGGPNDITVQTKDPSLKLVQIEFQDASGKKIKQNGWSSHSDHGTEMKTYNFPSKLPETTQLVIYISTQKSIVRAPFVLTNIFLP
jgi:hypothetical protein